MESHDPRVSVVMITYNRRDEAIRTLARLIELPERPRIVVVDNASTDGTAAAIRSEFAGKDVEVVEAGANLGAAGRNVGARHVETPYIAFCDDDTWWEPGMLRRAADLFDAHPKLAVIIGRTLVGPEELEDPICRELEESPLPREEGMPGPPVLGFLAGASVLRRAAFLEVGGFDPLVLINGEEEWVAVELAARGHWLCYVPELVVHHHPSAVRDVHARRWQGVRNTLWFLWLRRPWPSALRRTWRLVREVPRDRATRRGFAAALTGLPRLLPRRRVVPPAVERALRLLDPRSS
ncbi:MAG TPA: glycosyltransferase [Isosphaeraceae bacterium]|jgi:GT2 family glycosyltransferase|nr:glycosyltransferase [Isosphaeraceae bacterium]